MPDKSPLVSIGMPLYNEERYLRQALDSLISQDYANFELIISDNASVDGTSDICQEYVAKDRRVHYYRNETNIGAAVNFKRVFELAHGDYFVWAAGHDLWHPTFLSRCLEIFSQDESLVLCHPQAMWINTDGQPLGLIPSSVETRGLNRISRFNVVLWGLGYCYPVYGLISSQALRKVSLGLQVIATDAILLAELSLLGAFAHISAPLFYIRKMEDFGSWDKYFEKIFMQNLSGLSAHSLYWQMIGEYLKIVNKHINCSFEKDAATLSTVICLREKSSWILRGLQNSKVQGLSSNSVAEKLINQLGSKFHSLAMDIEQLFTYQDDKIDSRSPKIIIDAIFFQIYKTGIARVWKSLLEEWIKTDFAKHIIILDRSGTAPKISGYQYRLIPSYLSDSSDAAADREMLEQICIEEEASLFISTYYTTPISTPSVFMAYDMIPEVMRWDMNLPVWQDKHHAIRHASSYLAISENTANDLVTFFPEISRESIEVAHCGFENIFTQADCQKINELKNKYGIAKPYFLLVGLRDGYKNVRLFFQAFYQLENQDDFVIVCVGGEDKLEEGSAAYVSETNVHLLPRIDDAELRVAYSGATALVYPSKYEGFGLPIVEAMACGCPIITCPNSSIPEVAGEAALYVKDDDVEAMTIALANIQKPDVRESLIAAGFEQSTKFSWSGMAKKVSSVLIEATLLPLKLRETNFIIFPDWSQSEPDISRELEKVITTILTHPDSQQITLLIDTSNLDENSEIDANLLVSGVVMNLLMQEDLEMTGEPEISLVGKLGELQWQALLPRIQDRISLVKENEQAIGRTLLLSFKCS
ncbi:glycosyltransferase [Microcoleus sp. A2-C5]|uniref:glycosyltransferase n=1 Tax=unclassified Microcoleus TaxID=2642155 RepID=UPI002FD1830E